MADRPSSFVRDWIAENVQGGAASGDSVEAHTARTVAELKRDAEKAGLDMSDPELADDLLRDEVHAAIKRIHSAEGSGAKPPDDNLDHYALGYYAPSKGIARASCPYAEGMDAHDLWLAGYDAAGRGEKLEDRQTGRT